MPKVDLRGVCPGSLEFDVDGDVVRNVRFIDGCPGNLEAVSRLVEGRQVQDVIDLLEGIRCGKKSTSCPDQLAKALKQV